MASSQPLTASAAPVTPAAQAIQASPVLAGAAYQPQVPVAAMVAQPVAYGVPSAGYGGAPQGYGGAPQGYGAQGVTAYSAGAQGKAAPQGYYGVQPQQPPPQAYLSVPLAPGGVWMNEQYCGVCSILIAVFFFPVGMLIGLCPVDSRQVYMPPNQQVVVMTASTAIER